MAERANGQTCIWCGEEHEGACERVQTVEYYPGGAVKTVRFWSPTSSEMADGNWWLAQLDELGLGSIHRRDLGVVLLLGEKGASMRQDLMAGVAEHWGGISPQSGSIKRALCKMRDAGLVVEEKVKPSLPQGGAYRAHRVSLSPRGRGLYLFLTGEEPARDGTEAGQAGEQENG